jgi:hypothetical protein
LRANRPSTTPAQAADGRGAWLKKIRAPINQRRRELRDVARGARSESAFFV